MKRIGMGIVGTGFIGPHHIDAVRRLGFVDVVAVAEMNDTLAREKAAALGIPLHALLTKADKLSRGPGKSTLLAVRRELAAIPATTVQLFSALSGEGIDEARTVLDRWYSAPREADIG